MQYEQTAVYTLVSEMMKLFNKMVNNVVTQHDGAEVVDAANYLTQGFQKLQASNEPRLQVQCKARLLYNSTFPKHSGGVTQANIYCGTAPDSQMLLVQLLMGKRGKTG